MYYVLVFLLRHFQYRNACVLILTILCIICFNVKSVMLFFFCCAHIWEGVSSSPKSRTNFVRGMTFLFRPCSLPSRNQCAIPGQSLRRQRWVVSFVTFWGGIQSVYKHDDEDCRRFVRENRHGGEYRAFAIAYFRITLQYTTIEDASCVRKHFPIYAAVFEVRIEI